MTNLKSDRLFVPLASGPFDWFAAGSKRWELRRYGRQYTDRSVVPGRRVELRRGYRDADRALWGTVTTVARAKGLDEFFRKVPFQQVIPIATSQSEAIQIAGEILSILDEPFAEVLGFYVELDPSSPPRMSRQSVDGSMEAYKVSQ